MLNDFTHALRLLRRSPAFALASTGTLALAMGSTLAIFALAYGILLRPLPVLDEGRLVVLFGTDNASGRSDAPVPYVRYVEWKEHSRTLAQVAILTRTVLDAAGERGRVHLPAEYVSDNFFDTLGVSPAIGRGIAGTDPASIVISDRLWERRFGRDPGILGQLLPMRASGRTFTIAGVMPAGFERWRGSTDVWLPLTAQSDFERTRISAGYLMYTGIGRLTAPATAQSAASELQTLISPVERERGRPRGVNVVPLRQDVVSSGARAMLIFLGIAALLVWVIACANIGGLIWSRNTERAPEFAVRIAIGATPWRVARHIAVEALVIAVAGALAGLGLAVGGIRLLLAYSPPALARPDLVSFDVVAAAVAVTLTLLTTVLIGAVPMAQIFRRRLSGLMAEARGQSTRGRGARHLHDLLVAGEVAIAVLVFVCAALVVRSFVRLQQVDLGFTPGPVLSLRVNLPPPSRRDTSVETSARVNRIYDDVRGRLAASPGVEGVALGSELPIPSREWRTSVWLDDGRRILNGGPNPEMVAQAPGLHFVSPGYFDALGTRVVRGRDFTSRDRIDSPPVVIVNETMARLLLTGSDALGRRIRHDRNGRDESMDVVAVVADIRYVSPETPVKPEMYVPLAQWDLQSAVVLLSTVDDPMRHAAAARVAITAIDRDILITDVTSVRNAVAEATAEPRYRAGLMTAFGALAAILAASGLFALLAAGVARRRRELGIRLALGADPGALMRLVLRQALRVLVPAILLGIAAAFASTRLLAAHLFGVSAWDPVSFGCGAAGLLTIGLIASWIPARRAARVDPLVALRAE
ncbi:MAG: ADOP family duplicated permease [Vicinamibacterales bacterium]